MEHARSLPVALPVLVVGAGPVGLSLSLMLSRHGVQHAVIDKHPGTSRHPKARGLSIRTMELFRELGVDERLRAAGAPAATRGGVTFARTLSDPDYVYVAVEDGGTTARLSPATSAGCPQDELERILADEAGRSGVLRFDHELTGLLPGDGEVQATVRDRHGGGTQVVRAQYLVGAEIGRASCRERVSCCV